MGRRRVWKKTVVLELEVPEDSDDGFQRALVTFKLPEEGELPGISTYRNSVKVDTATDILNCLAGEFTEFLASQVPHWREHLAASETARWYNALRQNRAVVLYKGEEWLYGGPDNDTATRHRLYQDEGREIFVFNGEFQFSQNQKD